VDRVELTRDGEVNTLDSDVRWKKHYRTAKMQCYLAGGVSSLFRENYDLIQWDTDDFRNEQDGDASGV
jgi:hypothetical protein